MQQAGKSGEIKVVAFDAPTSIVDNINTGLVDVAIAQHPAEIGYYGVVSAYAHLKDMSVAKGDVVNRGDNIGSAGMTGGVSRPQLHFELRKGATPVDPVPLLAS